MITATKRAETPVNSQMTIAHQLPVDHTGKAADNVFPTVVTVSPTVNGHFGASAVQPGKLSRAGVVAMLGAINTYLSGLSAAQQDSINTQIPGGMAVTLTPTLVQVPCAPAGVGALASSIATVLSTGGNVVNI